jgi:hypothetical protein
MLDAVTEHDAAEDRAFTSLAPPSVIGKALPACLPECASDRYMNPAWCVATSTRLTFSVITPMSAGMTSPSVP